MKRLYLAAAVAVAPILAASGVSLAATTISTSTTTPVATATAKNGAPDDVDIATGGSINPTSAGAALTLNSNNVVTSEGGISFKDVDNAVGILVQGGNTGQVTNSGAISLTESYTATDTNNDGLPDGPFAKGMARTGIEVTGVAPFVGSIVDTGAITVQGNDSQGISIRGPMTGDLTMLKVTPASGTTAATVAAGSINITGDHSVGLQVTSTGGVGGNIHITSISARGVGAQAVAIDGGVGGVVDISGAVSSSGYRSVTRSNFPALATLYTAEELRQGGPTVSIGANLGKGLIVSVAPTPLSTTNLDQDGNGVPDAIQGNGTVTAYGSAPAMSIGSTARSVELGAVGTGANGYGLVIQGSVNANGVFDPLTTPNLPGVVPATAIEIGVTGGAPVIVDGGVHNSGVIGATAYQADATGIHVRSGATAAAIVNDGVISSLSTQVNSSTTATTTTPVVPAPLPVTVSGIVIDAGASVSSISNSRTISANITGTGGVGGTAQAIVDRSGSVTSVVNTGVIAATLTQTLVNTPMPGSTIGIDISASGLAQNITQKLASGIAGAPTFSATTAYAIGATVIDGTQAYTAIAATTAGQDPITNPSLWKAIGTTTPLIAGSIYFGSGGSTLEVEAGTVTADVIDLGAGANTVTVNGDVNTIVTGAIRDAGANTLVLNVMNGTLSDTNPAVIQAKAVNVGAGGILLVSADPLNNTNTRFVTTGASTFADGAQLGLTLKSLQTAPVATYTVVQTKDQGTLSVGAFGTSLLANSPYLFTAAASFTPDTHGGGSIDLTVTRKTAAQLNFNGAEAAAFEAVLHALPNDANIQKVVLAQTTEAGLKSAYDQLLPDQGQGMFEALDAAAQAVSSMVGTTPDAGTRVGGSSLWLQEVNQRVDRNHGDTLASSAKLLGIVGGYERMGQGGGALGVNLAYFNAQEQDKAAAVGEHVVGSMVEGGVYYRRAAGPFTMAARGAVGYSWFSGDRRFLAPGAINRAQSSWGGLFFDAHAGAAYEKSFGVFYVRPEISLDYFRLHEGARSETGGGDGFDLDVAARTSRRLSGQAQLVLGRQWGKTSWLRTEVRAGYREIFSGRVGDTVANFAGGDPFTLVADPDKGGWATLGVSLKSGTQFSYVALEADADFRQGEQRYDVRVAGRSMF